MSSRPLFDNQHNRVPVCSWLATAGVGLVLLGSCAAIGQDFGTFATWIWLCIGLGVLGGGLVVWVAWMHREVSPGPAWWMLVVVVAVSARLLLLPSDRMLSDDACRYHWDGKTLLHGLNPYLYAPSDSALDAFRTDSIDKCINHPARHTVYPPLAQGMFALGYALSPGHLWGFQLLCMVSELVAALLLVRGIRKLRHPQAWLLLLVWSPLVVVQGYLPGHVELLALPWFVYFVLAVLERQPVAVGLSFAACCLIKPLVLLYCPMLIWRFRDGGWRVIGGLVAMVLLVAYLPFLAAGTRLFQSMWLMATTWSFNASLSDLLAVLLSPMVTRLVLVSCLLLMALLAIRLGRDVLAQMQLTYAAFVLTTTTLFPWYVIWVLPLVVLRPDPALLILILLVPLADVVVIDHVLNGHWALQPWVPWVEYLPFVVLGILSAFRGWGMFQRNSRSLAANT